MPAFVRSLRVLLRAETLIAGIHMRALTRRAGLFAFAGLLGLFGLGMLNVAGYFALEPRWGAATAAAFVALGDFIVAAVAVVIAVSAKPGRELDLATELRQSAIEDLEAEAALLQQQLNDVVEEVRGVRNSLSAFMRDPLGAIAPTLLMPLINTIVGALRKTKKK